MKGKGEYDERQILERGKAFRNGYISLAVAMLVCYFINSGLNHSMIDDFSQLLFCIWVSIVVVSVTMIVRNAYDGIYEGRNAVVVWVMGAAGIFILFAEIIKWFRGTLTFYSNAGTVFSGVSLLIICAVYSVKRQRDRKRDNSEEKP